VDDALHYASYLVCGQTKDSEGCFASGSLGPFGHIGALLEDSPVITGNAVTRRIYVLDVANGPEELVALYVYTKTDIVTNSGDAVTVKADRRFELPLVGGKTVTPFLAGNNAALFVGTNKSEQAVILKKNDLQDINTIGAGSPPAPVAAITANSYGYVTIVWSDPNASFEIFDPTGAGDGDGGGQEFVINNLNGVVPQQIAP
jgi:hypothetical protein